MNSGHELVLARVRALLLAADIVGINVERDRADDLPAESELPAIRVLRGAVDSQPFGDLADKNIFNFKLEFLVAGAGREAAIDALHVAANAALQADEPLQALGLGLRCIGTDEPEHVAGDPNVARMTATYQIKTLTRVDTLARI